jgi:GntR family transcriptional regulator
MGIVIKEARHVIKTVELSGADAMVLNMSPGDVCLAMERLTFSKQGHPMELMTYIYPPGRMSFEMTLPRENSNMLIKRAG